MRKLIFASAAFLALANCTDTSDLRSLPAGPASNSTRGLVPNISISTEVRKISNFCATFVDEQRVSDELARAGYEFSQSKYSANYELFQNAYAKAIDAPKIGVEAKSSRPTSWSCELTYLTRNQTDGSKVISSFKQAMTKRGWKPIEGTLSDYTKNGRIAEIGGRFKVTGTNADVKVWIRQWKNTSG